ncbi:MAG: cytochrome c oxidase assembly protein, partial [Firmicutes bacterium]|nr:cytochrome c oxidase assembly protein [Bacillota bacterium]
LLRFLARADVAFFSFNGLSALLLMPAVYDRVLASGPLQGISNLALVVTALIFWLPVLNPLPELPPLTPGKRLLYLFFAADAVTSMVGFLFVDPPLYRPYFGHTTAFGLTPLADQQLGATLLLALMVLVYGTAFFATFLRYQGGMAAWYE